MTDTPTVEQLRSDVFAILRRHDVSEQCFAEADELTDTELRAIAEAATQAKWHLMTGAIGVNPWISVEAWTRPDGSYSRGGCILNMVAHDEREQDARHIATFDPATIIALLDRLAAHEAERSADKARIAELAAILPTKLCGESWNLPDTESVTIVTTFGKLKAARTALERTGA